MFEHQGLFSVIFCLSWLRMSTSSLLSVGYFFAAVTSGLLGGALQGYVVPTPPPATETTTTSLFVSQPVSANVTEVVCRCVCTSTPCSTGAAASAIDSGLSLAAAAAAGGGTTEVVRRRLRGKQSQSAARPDAPVVHQQSVRAEVLAAALEGLREEPSTPTSSSRHSTRPPTPPGPITGPPITRASRALRHGGSLHSA